MAENNEGGVCTTKGDLILRAEDVVAGMAGPLEALRELVLWPLLYSQEAACLGLKVYHNLLFVCRATSLFLVQSILLLVKTFCCLLALVLTIG